MSDHGVRVAHRTAKARTNYVWAGERVERLAAATPVGEGGAVHGRGKRNWLPGKDSNLDSTVQNRAAYHWPTRE